MTDSSMSHRDMRQNKVPSIRRMPVRRVPAPDSVSQKVPAPYFRHQRSPALAIFTLVPLHIKPHFHTHKFPAAMLNCSAEEDVFGPFVAPSCLHGFDFTLLFEESILTIGPIGVVCLAASIRIWKLSGVPEKVNRSWLYATKEV